MDHIVVKVIGAQRDIYGQESRIEIKAAGRYYQKNGMHYVVYQDKESLEHEEPVTTILKIGPDHVKLLRMGAIDQNQEFRVGEKKYSTYVTHYGRMNMAVTTKKMDIVIGLASGVIDINYELEVDGQWQSDNTLSISIQEGQNFEH